MAERDPAFRLRVLSALALLPVALAVVWRGGWVFAGFVALMVGLLAALVPAAVVVARRGVADARKTALPLAPFLAIGAIVGLFAGDALLAGYLSLG